MILNVEGMEPSSLQQYYLPYLETIFWMRQELQKTPQFQHPQKKREVQQTPHAFTTQASAELHNRLFHKETAKGDCIGHLYLGILQF